MHKDLIEIADVKKPEKNTPYIIYFSSKSNNTHRFIQKLELENDRIPFDENETFPKVKREYVLICPTYSGGDNSKGAVPLPVIKFLNVKENRELCRGVVATGNTNFGNQFALAGPILSKKLQVPLLYQLELLGTSSDVTTLKTILNKFWGNDVD